MNWRLLQIDGFESTQYCRHLAYRRLGRGDVCLLCCAVRWRNRLSFIWEYPQIVRKP